MLVDPLGLPSARIAIHEGLTGDEPKDVPRYAPCPSPTAYLCVAIRTGYAEVHGGYYFNRALLGLVGDALDRARLSVVQWDLYDAHGPVPVEAVDTVELNEEYALLRNDGTIGGRLLAWESGEPGFYLDAIGFQLDMAPDDARVVRLGLVAICRDREVRVDDESPAGL